MIKRPILVITVCYIISILLGVYFKKYIPFFCLVMLLFNIFVYYNKNKHIANKKIFNNTKLVRKNNFIFINICILIILISTIIIRNKDDSFQNFEVKDNYISTAVKVDRVESESEYYLNYIVKIIGQDERYKNNKLYLKVKKNRNSTQLDYGDIVYISGNFEKGEVRRNYKGFSYFDYLKTKNIYGIVKCDNIKFLKNDSTNVYNVWISNVHKRLKNNVKALLPEKNVGIALALLLGDSSEITENQKDVFSNANLSHVLAISGMHVSYAITGLSLLLKKISKRKSKLVFIVFLIFFASITGAAPSVVRAVIMSVLTIVASLIYRKSDTLNNIAISCLIILIYNPYNLFNLGFQLSFLGTLGIVLFNARINYKLINICKQTSIPSMYILIENKKFQNLIKLLSVSISANILIFPVLLYNFNTVSFVFIISNLLVTPVLGALIFSGYFAIILSTISIKISFLPAKLFNFMINIFYKIAECSSGIRWLRFLAVTPKVYTIFILYLIIAFIYFYEDVKKYFDGCSKVVINRFQINVKVIFKRMLAFVIVVSIIFKILNFYNKDFTIHLVDVGQGDCTLIITSSNKTILIDGGGSERGDYDVGEEILVPYLLDRQIKTIDYILFSHFDSDHCQGLFSVMKELKVKFAIISEQSKISSNYKYFLQIAEEKRGSRC